MNIYLYRFKAWSISEDKFFESARWGTEAGIRKICAEPIDSSQVLVDADKTPCEFDGLTVKGFDPGTAPPRPASFPNEVGR
jgi:hypothetical protein